jgi:S-adenosylmethionine hydrolase
MSRGCITLVTDFGTSDPYVAAMKGVALSINPELTLVDVSHDVGPHDIAEAAYVLRGVLHYYPAGTIHVVVVDPGVGSERRILAAQVDDQIVLAPDNGFLDLLLDGEQPGRLVNVTNTEYFHHPVSLTFHGRDVFGPVAAHLTLGVDLCEMGHDVDEYVKAEAGMPHRTDEGIEGAVIHVDRFGNLVTNIPKELLRELGDEVRVQVGGEEIVGVDRIYADVPEGHLLALIGSTGMLELSANQVSAADVLGVGRRTTVQVVRDE